jgi:hypothetical protein
MLTVPVVSAMPSTSPPRENASVGDIIEVIALIVGIPASIVAIILLREYWKQLRYKVKGELVHYINLVFLRRDSQKITRRFVGFH